MRELYIRYSNIIFEKFSMNVINHLTLSAMGYGIWRTLLDNNISIQIPTWEEDEFIRKALYGGRCLNFKR